MSRSKEIQVGVTVIVSLVVLALGMMWLKQVRLSGGSRIYSVEFASVSGLKNGDRVQVLGIKRGSVAGFEQLGGRVRVSIELEKSVVLHQDARISLVTLGIVGEKLVEIDPGQGAPVAEGHVFQGRADADMAELTAAGAVALEDARRLNEALMDFLAVLRREGRIDSTLSATLATMESLRKTSDQAGPDLVKLTRELRGTVGALNAAVAGPDSNLARALGSAGNAAVSADSLSVQLTLATRSLLGILEKLDKGQGTAGLLLNDNTLHAEAESTIVMIQDLVKDMKAKPKRYFHFSLF